MTHDTQTQNIPHSHLTNRKEQLHVFLHMALVILNSVGSWPGAGRGNVVGGGGGGIDEDWCEKRNCGALLSYVVPHHLCSPLRPPSNILVIEEDVLHCSHRPFNVISLHPL